MDSCEVYNIATAGPFCKISHLNMKDGIVKLMNRNKRRVSQLYRVLPFNAVLYAVANLGTPCLCQGENAVLICESAVLSATLFPESSLFLPRESTRQVPWLWLFTCLYIQIKSAQTVCL